LGYVVVWTMVVNQLWLPLAIWAQEAEVSPTPTPEVTPTDEVTPTPEENPPPEEITATPTPEETVTLEVIPTIKITPIPEETPTPEVTSTEVASASATPTPEVTPTPEADDFAIDTATESAQLAPIDEVILVIPKSAVGNLGQVSGEGDNGEIEVGNGVIETGQAVAVVNVINLVNTNIESGTIGIYLVDQLSGDGDEEKNDLNLNDVWKLSNQTEGDTVHLDGTNSFGWLNMWLNQTSINNDVTVAANSGLNLIGETDEAFIITGDATALANVLNIVNANFFNSKVFLGIINIDGASLGNIILPRPELFAEDQGENQNGGTMSNIIDINNASVAVANSGGNETVGQEDSTIVTGDALALVNNMTMVNVGGGGNDMFYFNLNTTGENSGQIYNWLSPGTAMDMAQFVNVFGLGMGNADGSGGLAGGLNVVNINNNVTAVANSGLNQIWGGGSAEIMTGSASSIINLANFVNLNLFNNNWFYGLANIVGNWDGNIIFAYPDLAISLSSQAKEVKNGDGLVFELSYFNQGYDESLDTKIELNLPSEFKYISDNSGFEVNQRGNRLSWVVDRVGQGQGGSFEIVVETQVKKSILAGIIKSVWAADDVEVNTESIISTSLPESDMDNNYALVKTSIVMFDDMSEENGNTDNNETNNNYDENSGTDPRQAIITVESRNNVADFVYTGDVVSFDVDVKNESDVPALESFLACEIYDQSGTLLKYFEINVGKIGAYKSGKVSFGLPISTDMGVGKMESMMMIYAKAINGNELESNISMTEFNVKSKLVNVGMGNGQVLAQTDFADEGMFDNGTRSVNLAIYLLLFVVTAGWIYRQSKTWSVGGKKGIKIFNLGMFVMAIGGFVYSLLMIVVRT